MLAALALKVNLDGESLEDKKWFDMLLIMLQFAGPFILLIQQYISGGIKGVLKENVDEISVMANVKESFDGTRNVFNTLRQGKDSNNRGEVEMMDFGHSDEMKYVSNTARDKISSEIGGRPFGGIGSEGRGDIRAVSIGEVEIGGNVVSKHEKYKKRAEEARNNDYNARVEQLKRGFSSGSQKATKKAPEKGAKTKTKTKTKTTYEYGTAAEEEKVIDIDIPPPLQTNWDRYFDDESGQEYFQNRLSGETAWERPDG